MSHSTALLAVVKNALTSGDIPFTSKLPSVDSPYFHSNPSPDQPLVYRFYEVDLGAHVVPASHSIRSFTIQDENGKELHSEKASGGRPGTGNTSPPPPPPPYPPIQYQPWRLVKQRMVFSPVMNESPLPPVSVDHPEDNHNTITTTTNNNNSYPRNYYRNGTGVDDDEGARMKSERPKPASNSASGVGEEEVTEFLRVRRWVSSPLLSSSSSSSSSSSYLVSETYEVLVARFRVGVVEGRPTLFRRNERLGVSAVGSRGGVVRAFRVLQPPRESSWMSIIPFEVMGSSLTSQVSESDLRKFYNRFIYSKQSYFREDHPLHRGAGGEVGNPMHRVMVHNKRTNPTPIGVASHSAHEDSAHFAADSAEHAMAAAAAYAPASSCSLAPTVNGDPNSTTGARFNKSAHTATSLLNMQNRMSEGLSSLAAFPRQQGHHGRSSVAGSHVSSASSAVFCSTISHTLTDTLSSYSQGETTMSCGHSTRTDESLVDSNLPLHLVYGDDGTLTIKAMEDSALADDEGVSPLSPPGAADRDAVEGDAASLVDEEDDRHAHQEREMERQLRKSSSDMHYFWIKCALKTFRKGYAKEYEITAGWKRWDECCHDGLNRFLIVNSIDDVILYCNGSRKAAYAAVQFLDRFVAVNEDPREICREISNRVDGRRSRRQPTFPPVDFAQPRLNLYLIAVIGVCCMLGCKMEDMLPPAIERLTKCLRVDLQEEEFLQLEMLVFEKLGFNLLHHTMEDPIEALLYLFCGDNDALYDPPAECSPNQSASRRQHRGNNASLPPSPWKEFQHTCRYISDVTLRGMCPQGTQSFDEHHEGFSALDLNPLILSVAVVGFAAKLLHVQLPEPFLTLFPVDFQKSIRDGACRQLPLVSTDKRYMLMLEFVRSTQITLSAQWKRAAGLRSRPPRSTDVDSHQSSSTHSTGSGARTSRGDPSSPMRVMATALEYVEASHEAFRQTNVDEMKAMRSRYPPPIMGRKKSATRTT